MSGQSSANGQTDVDTHHLATHDPEAGYTIGDLARLSGLPVKTIRHYSDVGVLPPAARTEAGYRLYGEADRAKLELVRTLRALDLDLPTIRRVLEQKATLQEVLALHARAVAAQLAALRRQQTVLQAAIARGADPAYVRRAHAVARLTVAERGQLVADFLDGVFEDVEDVPAANDLRAKMLEASLVDLPPEPTPEQLDAWLELIDLVTDEDFQRFLREGTRDFWGSLPADVDYAAHNKVFQEIVVAAAEAMRAGHPPTSHVAQELATAVAAAYVELLGRSDSPAFRAKLASDLEAGSDPRAERYWELVAIVTNRGPWPPPGCEVPEAVYDRAVYAWLCDALRVGAPSG